MAPYLRRLVTTEASASALTAGSTGDASTLGSSQFLLKKKRTGKKKAVSGFKPSSVEGVFAQGHCDLLAAGMEATTFWKQMLLLFGQMLADADGFRTEL